MKNKHKLIIAKLLYYEGQFDQIQIGAYDGSPAWNYIEDWISSTLKVNFLSDIYKNREVASLHRQNNVSDIMYDRYGNWFIGDALKDIVFHECRTKVTKETVKRIDKELKRRWKFFKKLITT